MSLDALRQWIESRGLRGTAEEIASQLNTKSEAIRSSEPITSTGLVLVLAPDLARRALAGFQQAAEGDPLLQSQWIKFNTTGIDLTHPLAQEMIAQLHAQGVFDAEVVQALSRVGVVHKSPAELLLGEGATVTVDQVQAALAPPEIRSRRLVLNLLLTSEGQLRGTALVQECSARSVVRSIPRDDLIAEIRDVIQQRLDKYLTQE